MTFRPVASLLFFVPAVLASMAVAGCSAPTGDEGSVSSGAQADSTTTAPQMVFDGTWGYHGVGTRTPGAVAHVVYDTSRLAKCRATQDSRPAWAIVAFVSADGGPAKSYPLPTGTEGAAVAVPIEIPYASDMAIWFESTDDSGCEQWDSSFGANYHFSVAAPTRSVIHLDADFTTHVQSAPGLDYPLKAGQSVDIDYDFARLPLCRGYLSGNMPAWAVTMWFQRDGGTPVAADLDVAVDGSFRVQQPGHIELPAGTKNLTVWFENNDVFGCNAWDSNYGQNYSFDVR